MVWKTIGAEASIVVRQLQQNAYLAHIITTWLWFIFRYWSDLSPALFLFLWLTNPQCLPLGHSSLGCTAVLVKAFFFSFFLVSPCVCAVSEGDNGLGFSTAPWSFAAAVAFSALFLWWNQIAFSPLRSKWSLPSALLRMLQRHPSRNCTWDGGGCDWICWGGGVKSQRAHHYNNLPDSYATAKNPQDTQAENYTEVK